MGQESQRPRGLLAVARDRMRLKHLSRRTEQAYLGWMRRFVRFHDRRHPRELGKEAVEAFLTYLAVERRVAPSTQNQALGALLFLYREVLGIELGWLDRVERAKRPRRLPVVLPPEEVAAVLARLTGSPWLIGSLLYGSGRRLLECLRLRIKDLDLSRREIRIRSGKGDRDRVTMIPMRLVEPLRTQIERVAAIHAVDLDEGCGAVLLPGALGQKKPGAALDLAWQFVFPAPHRSRDQGSAIERRHHVHETAVQRAFRRAVQQLLGHRSVQTTMIYTHVLNRGGLAVRSPLDRI